MWTSTALLALLALLAVTAATPLPDQSSRYIQASKEHLERQKQILKLFLLPTEHEAFPELTEIAENWNIEEHTDQFRDSSYVKKFVKFQKAGLLYPKDGIFHRFSKQVVKNIEGVFDILFFAKDLDTFTLAATYLRKHLHAGVFYYAFRTALAARDDTKDFFIPPFYEVYPYTSLDERVIQDAQQAIIRGYQSENFGKVVIISNYSNYWDANVDPETSTSYFTENIFLNNMHVGFEALFPSWWNSSKYGIDHDRKGELFLNYHRQLLAKYYLERLSTNLGEVPYLTKDSVLPAYFPHLRYIDGQEVTPRQPHTTIRDTYEIALKDIEYWIFNLWRAIDAGYIIANGTKIPLDYPQGLDVLGRVSYFWGDAAHDELYGSLFNRLIHFYGHLVDPENNNDLAPPALLRTDTALRDPLYYYAIYKFFGEIIYTYLDEKVPKYSAEDLFVPGLKIEDVHIDDFYTYFEDFDVDLLSLHPGPFEKDRSVHAIARTRSLNHRPFTFKVDVNSDKDLDVVVKILISPKYDGQHRKIPFNEKVFYSFEIDRFLTKIPAGKSTIERKSEDSTVGVKDPLSFFEIWRKVQAALDDKEPLKLDKFARPYGFPQRLLIPKGTREGLPVQFVVVIYPYEQADVTDRAAYNVPSFSLFGAPYGIQFPDPRPIAYPSDRLYHGEHGPQVPTIFGKEVRIFQKTQEELNVVPDVHHD